MEKISMNVKSNIWLEIDGQVVISAWRVRLLEAIQQTGSISQAAKVMNIPYRRAWQKIQESEERLGIKLVETQTGGIGGGGAQLTPECKKIMAKYGSLTEGISTLLQTRFKEIFFKETKRDIA
jgi:molybdate transport system regulatory protein